MQAQVLSHLPDTHIGPPKLAPGISSVVTWLCRVVVNYLTIKLTNY
jgi:hypothetical protein